VTKRFFVMISTDPDVDSTKCGIGLACAAQAISDGHEVDVFFAAHAVKLLQEKYFDDFANRWALSPSLPPGAARTFLNSVIEGSAGVHCSTGSQAAIGITPENAQKVLIGGYELNWNGPPGVVALSSAADVTLTF